MSHFKKSTAISKGYNVGLRYIKIKKHLPNARRQQYNRERREAWLKERKSASGSGPSTAALATAAPSAGAAATIVRASATATAAPTTGAAAAKAIAAASATAARSRGAAYKETTAASATAVILSTEAAATATTTGESATDTPPRKKTKAISVLQRCSSRDAVIGKRKAVASPETQRVALDSNHYLDLALDRNLDLDRELDSPTATAAPSTALGMAVPGTAVTAAASSTTPSPPEAPNLKKYPMSYLPAHQGWFLCLTCKGGRHRIQEM
jgi:hypothetical protein